MKIGDLRNINEPVFYVTNDVGRGIGLESLLPNYHIICLDDHPLVDYLKKAGVSVFCLERELGKKNILARTTGNILAQPSTLTFIKEKAAGETPLILFFKPQKKIETLAREHKFFLVGNLVEINRRFEDKVAFFEFCQKKGIKTIPGEIAELNALSFKEMGQRYGKVLVLQFGRGWAGNTTFFIKTEEELEKLKRDYGQLRVKVGRLIEGITLLNNAVVLGDEVLVSRPALQIKPHPFLTVAPGGTSGRQWPAPIDSRKEEKIKEITQRVGQLMAKEGYRGFFGLDFLIDEISGEIFVSENNARLTASVPFYTKLELKANVFPLLGYHLLSFLAHPCLTEKWEAPFLEGSEIVLRNTSGVAVKVHKPPTSGLYSFPFVFKEENYFLLTQNKDEFWLMTAAEGRRVNPEIELAKINTLERVCNEKGELAEKYFRLVEQIKGELELEEC